MARPRSWTDEQLVACVAASKGWREVARRLGLTHGARRALVTHTERLGLSTEHFVARSDYTRTPNYTSDEFFVVGCVRAAKDIKRRLIAMGVPFACAICGLTEWMGQVAPLQVDHKNGVHTDNRIENLRFLCPNCHSQTETWGGRNKRNKR